MTKKQTNQDLDFEIAFFEAVVDGSPYFIEALMALGDSYTKKGFYQKGLEIDLRLDQLRREDPHILYNLACSYSLLHHLDQALDTIKSAVRYGYDHLEYLQYDSDLANLHRDSRYQEFISDLFNKKTASH